MREGADNTESTTSTTDQYLVFTLDERQIALHLTSVDRVSGAHFLSSFPDKLSGIDDNRRKYLFPQILHQHNNGSASSLPEMMSTIPDTSPVHGLHVVPDHCCLSPRKYM